jgi:HK97 family phage prohead protease
MPEMEVRAVEGIELRAEAGQPPRLIGYAAVFNSRSQDLGGFVEIIRPGAFSRTLAAKPDIRALVNHDRNRIIGRTTNGSLKVAEDERGLRVEITPIDTQAGVDIVKDVRAGNIDGMSFAFFTPLGGDRWVMGADPPLRELVSVDLIDVSPVVYPAYLKTDVAVRAFGQERQAWKIAEARRRRLAAAEAAIARR